MPKQAIFLFCIFALSACVDPNTKPVATRPAQTAQADLAAVHSSVGANLKDPGSMQIRSVRAYTTQDGERIICGEYNAKNSFGAYTGFTPFFLRTRSGVVVASNSYNAGDRILNASIVEACADAAAGVVKINPDV